jgi:hypothetical protein
MKPPTSQELLQDLLDFLQRKFYPDRPKAFAQDRRRLLDWVILWPAKWLDERGVTIPATQYKDLFFRVFMDGLRFGNTGNVTYLPAWLAKVIQSHFVHHGDEIYQQAKSVRTMTENAMVLAGRLVVKNESISDPVRDLANAALLLKKTSRRKSDRNSDRNTPKKRQLTLL